MDSGKCWPHRRPKIDRASARHAAWICFVLLGAAAAQDPAAPQQGGTGTGAVAYDEFIANVRSLRGTFEQELWSADDELLERSAGTMALARPNRFRWEYETPYEQVIVADGERLWIYDVELAQVTVAEIDPNAGASPALLLSGDEAVRESFAVVHTYALDGLQWVELEPRLGGADFVSVQIGFDGRTPRRIELLDGLDQVTRIELSDVELDPELPRDLFRFEPPAGVDVIGAEG